MTVVIEPVRAVHDAERDIVTFVGMDGTRTVRCLVTRQALRRRAESAMEMLEAYRSHASRIHRIAVRKYERHQLTVARSKQFSMNME